MGFELIFDVFRLTGKSAPDPGVQGFQLDDDTEDSFAFLLMTANGFGIPGMVSHKSF